MTMGGELSTHVLGIAQGRPAQDMRLTLYLVPPWSYSTYRGS
jgi:5-hydroxyisourate hydrolase-like protein (transthyretin family)